MQNKNQIKLYALKDYKVIVSGDSFKYTNGDAVDIFEGDIKSINKELKKNNKGYHERIHCDKVYTLFCDVDGLYNNYSDYKINDKTEDEQLNIFKSNLKEFFKDFFQKDLTKFTITKNNGYVKIDKDDPNKMIYGSYHVYCNEYKMTGNYQKIFWERFAQKYYATNVHIVDPSIFIKGRWFRSMNQHKAGIKGVEHIILEGKTIDTICENLDGREDLDYLFENIDVITKTPKIVSTKQKRSIMKKELSIIKKEQPIVKNNDIKNLLECLNIKRSDNYNDWYKCGLIIKYELGESGFNDFNSFSMKSKKYDKNEVFKMYENFKPHEKGLTISTLHYWAKLDNLELYNKLFEHFDFNSFFSNTAVSNHFKILFGDRFIYNDGCLYYFNGVYWKQDNKELLMLHNFLKEDYYFILIDLLHQYDKKHINTTIQDDVNSDHVKKIAKIIVKIEDLRNYKKREGYVKDIIGSIKNENIKFDTKSHLFAFENVIFDLKKNEIIEPDPLDYISLSTGYDYDKNYDMKKVDELDKLLDTILTNKEEKDSYLTILATGLLGITLERFTMVTGTGGNGKGLLNDLMLKTVGNYGYVVSSSFLTMPLKSGPNPEAANMHNKRFVIGREPQKGAKMCSSTIKEITGGDVINARKNHSNITETTIVSTLVYECNIKPAFDEVTDAVVRRLLEFVFSSRFVAKTDYDKLNKEDKKKCFIGNDFYKTNEFKNEYKQALFEILRKKAEIYYKENLKIPQSIKNNTMQYLALSDDLYDFVGFSYNHTKNNKDIVKLKELYRMFQYSEVYKLMSFADKREYNYKNFCNKLENNLFLRAYLKPDSTNVKCLYGFKLKLDEDEAVEEVENEVVDEVVNVVVDEVIIVNKATKKTPAIKGNGGNLNWDTFLTSTNEESSDERPKKVKNSVKKCVVEVSKGVFVDQNTNKRYKNAEDPIFDGKLF